MVNHPQPQCVKAKMGDSPEHDSYDRYKMKLTVMWDTKTQYTKWKTMEYDT